HVIDPLYLHDALPILERGRPTNRGITMCGNTTTSRRGSRGRSVGSEVRIWLADIVTFLKISAIDAKGKPGPPFSAISCQYRWRRRQVFQANQPKMILSPFVGRGVTEIRRPPSACGKVRPLRWPARRRLPDPLHR